MNTTVTIDRAGRVVLPKPLRDELRLEAGDSLELGLEGEQITLRPIRAKSPLRKDRGIWIFHGGGSLSVSRANELIAEAREDRNREIFRKKP